MTKLASTSIGSKGITASTVDCWWPERSHDRIYPDRCLVYRKRPGAEAIEVDEQEKHGGGLIGANSSNHCEFKGWGMTIFPAIPVYESHQAELVQKAPQYSLQFLVEVALIILRVQLEAWLHHFQQFRGFPCKVDKFGFPPFVT